MAGRTDGAGFYQKGKQERCPFEQARMNSVCLVFSLFFFQIVTHKRYSQATVLAFLIRQVINTLTHFTLSVVRIALCF